MYYLPQLFLIVLMSTLPSVVLKVQQNKKTMARYYNNYQDYLITHPLIIDKIVTLLIQDTISGLQLAHRKKITKYHTKSHR